MMMRLSIQVDQSLTHTDTRVHKVILSSNNSDSNISHICLYKILYTWREICDAIFVNNNSFIVTINFCDDGVEYT